MNLDVEYGKVRQKEIAQDVKKLISPQDVGHRRPVTSYKDAILLEIETSILKDYKEIV